VARGQGVSVKSNKNDKGFARFSSQSGSKREKGERDMAQLLLLTGDRGVTHLDLDLVGAPIRLAYKGFRTRGGAATHGKGDRSLLCAGD
jgi:hypothetical protein